MYEKAKVFSYDTKKIWVKHIDENLYCINGICVAFLPQQNISSVSVLVNAINEWYSPLHKAVEHQTVIVYELEKETKERIYTTVYVKNLNQFECQSKINEILAEYDAWAKDYTDIYINDCRDMDINQWMYEVCGW